MIVRCRLSLQFAVHIFPFIVLDFLLFYGRAVISETDGSRTTSSSPNPLALGSGSEWGGEEGVTVPDPLLMFCAGCIERKKEKEKGKRTRAQPCCVDVPRGNELEWKEEIRLYAPLKTKELRARAMILYGLGWAEAKSEDFIDLASERTGMTTRGWNEYKYNELEIRLDGLSNCCCEGPFKIIYVQRFRQMIATRMRCGDSRECVFGRISDLFVVRGDGSQHQEGG